VQYLVVDSSATLWSDEAPYFKANLASKEDLASAVCKQSEVPKSSTLLLRDAHNMWMSWQAVDELPQDGVLCVKVVKPGAQGLLQCHHRSLVHLMISSSISLDG